MRARTFLQAPVVAALALAPFASVQAADPARLPDGEITQFGAFTAYLIEPTTRYDHGILGDAIEAGGFAVEHNGRRLVYRLPPDAVFEDLRVRLADLDGDGKPEAIVVKSYLKRGSALAAFSIGQDGIKPLAEGPAFGTPHRWLNPAGAADFTGSGETMIAAVLTPHIAGSLRLYRVKGGALAEAARFDGVTSHIIGTRNLDLARIDDVNGDGVPDVVLPVQDRRAVVAVSFKGGQPAVIDRATLPAPLVELKQVAHGAGRVKLENGSEVDFTLEARPR
jgi:hypothetical protein